MFRNTDGFMPACTVVVCTRNRPLPLAKCLDGLKRLTYPLFKILVVDSAPSTAEARKIAARFGVRYVVEPLPGLSRARNRGARSCETEIVAFIDDDAVPEPAWLAKLIREFEDPRVMVVTGRILPLRIETEAELDCALIDGFSDERRVVDRDTASWFELANFGGLGDGGNMAFRRRAFEIWPGFDERLGRGAILDESEEHHAFFSLLDRGYRVIYTPDAIVHHPYPRTMQDARKRHLKLNAASTAYITLLFVEEPRYRRRIVRYVAEGLTGTSRPWRKQLKPSPPGVFHTLLTLLARLCGPLLYVWLSIVRRLPMNSTKSDNRSEAEIATAAVGGAPPCEAIAIGEPSFRE